MGIGRLKELLIEAQKAQQQHRESWDKLESRRQDINAELATLDNDLATARAGKDEILTRFAKGQALMADVENARVALDEVTVKRNDAAELLSAVEKELYSTSAPETTGNPFYQAVEQAETALWRAISDAENEALRKIAIPGFARAYAAWLAANSRLRRFEEFLEEFFDGDVTYSIQTDAGKCKDRLLKDHK